MGAWDDLTFPTSVLKGIEPAAASPVVEEVVEAKQELVDRLRLYLDDLVNSEGVTETVFYDGLAGLASTTDVGRVLRRLLAKEHLYLYYRADAALPGRGETPERRMRLYDEDLRRDAEGFVTLVRRALDEDELTYTATRTQTVDAPVWAI